MTGKSSLDLLEQVDKYGETKANQVRFLVADGTYSNSVAPILRNALDTCKNVVDLTVTGCTLNLPWLAELPTFAFTRFSFNTAAIKTLVSSVDLLDAHYLSDNNALPFCTTHPRFRLPPTLFDLVFYEERRRPILSPPFPQYVRLRHSDELLKSLGSNTCRDMAITDLCTSSNAPGSRQLQLGYHLHAKLRRTVDALFRVCLAKGVEVVWEEQAHEATGSLVSPYFWQRRGR
ncbi:hypothetical protein JCM8547_004926 [Rhodosporidiobolus lusitaniae]